MTTAEIKTEVCRLAPNAHCIWPNGLGFTYRGWDYVYGAWGSPGWCARGSKMARSAGLQPRKLMLHVGRGESPTDAKANAYPHGEGAYAGWFAVGCFPPAFYDVPLPPEFRIITDNYEHGGERVAVIETSGRGRNRAIKVRTEAGVEFWTNPANLRK